jgi:hypothetical protein
MKKSSWVVYAIAFALLSISALASTDNLLPTHKEFRIGKVLDHGWGIYDYPLPGSVKITSPSEGYLKKYLTLEDTEAKPLRLVSVDCDSATYSQKRGAKISYVIETSFFFREPVRKTCI